jgi:FAD/FMN-containing dehydrogenase
VGAHRGVTLNLDDLRRSLAGTVIVLGDQDYDRARRGFNALVDRRPAVIARCTTSQDVATAFAFARANTLEVAVRGGGHNPAGHCVCEGGLVIDLSAMRTVDIDAGSRTARAGGGATWLDFDAATQTAGLVTPGGIVGSTGVAGLTFGGGIGHLTAQYGLTCDHVIAADLITPQGKSVRASAEENPDLLWALRGGGGNFGVATSVEFRLHPLEHVVGGMLVYRGDGVRDALRRFRDVAARSPRNLSCQASLGVDESLVPVLEILPCYTGTDEDPRELRELSTAPGLVQNGLRAHAFLDQQRLVNSAYGVNRHYWKGHFVRELSDDLIDELLVLVAALGRSPGGILFESLHGAPKDGNAKGAAVGFRDAAFNISAQAVWQDPTADAEEIDWARETASALEPWSFAGGGYVNYMQADEPAERVRAAFGAESFERLQMLKARFDPDNVLHRNQNIPLAG